MFSPSLCVHASIFSHPFTSIQWTILPPVLPAPRYSTQVLASEASVLFHTSGGTLASARSRLWISRILLTISALTFPVVLVGRDVGAFPVVLVGGCCCGCPNPVLLVGGGCCCCGC